MRVDLAAPADRQLYTLRRAYEEAHTEYIRQRTQIVRLLKDAAHDLGGPAFEAFLRQEIAERKALEKYRRTRRAYIEFPEHADA